MKIRLRVELASGDVLDTRVEATVRERTKVKPWTVRFQSDFVVSDQLVSAEIFVPWHGEIVVLRSVYFILDDGQLVATCERVLDVVAKITPDMELTFKNLDRLMTRVTHNEWSDRSLGRLAPKKLEEDVEHNYGG